MKWTLWCYKYGLVASLPCFLLWCCFNKFQYTWQGKAWCSQTSRGLWSRSKALWIYMGFCGGQSPMNLHGVLWWSRSKALWIYMGFCGGHGRKPYVSTHILTIQVERLLVAAQKQTTSWEILLWMTPSEAPKALQASECSELLDPTRANCWISAQHQPGKFTKISVVPQP